MRELFSGGQQSAREQEAVRVVRLDEGKGEQQRGQYKPGRDRATVAADELSTDELMRGARRLETKVARYELGMVAVVGIVAYRQAFTRPQATLGRQTETIAGRPLWVLPNPSGLNAHYGAPQLATLFRELHDAVDRQGTPRGRVNRRRVCSGHAAPL